MPGSHHPQTEVPIGAIASSGRAMPMSSASRSQVHTIPIELAEATVRRCFWNPSQRLHHGLRLLTNCWVLHCFLLTSLRDCDIMKTYRWCQARKVSHHSFFADCLDTGLLVGQTPQADAL